MEMLPTIHTAYVNIGAVCHRIVRQGRKIVHAGSESDAGLNNLRVFHRSEICRRRESKLVAVKSLSATRLLFASESVAFVVNTSWDAVRTIPPIHGELSFPRSNNWRRADFKKKNNLGLVMSIHTLELGVSICQYWQCFGPKINLHIAINCPKVSSRLLIKTPPFSFVTNYWLLYKTFVTIPTQQFAHTRMTIRLNYQT